MCHAALLAWSCQPRYAKVRVRPRSGVIKPPARYGRGLFHVNAAVYRDAGLQVRDVDKSGTQILAQLLELGGALMCRARRPALQAQENDDDDGCDNERHQRERSWPGDSSRS